MNRALETSSNLEDTTPLTKNDTLLSQISKMTLKHNEETSSTPPFLQHKFWKTQPVLQSLDQLENRIEDGPLEPNKSLDQIRKEPYKLPESFEWVEIDVENENELSELYDLLANNYVEDEDASFRFAYPKDFLKWALRPPGWKKYWHVGVRITSSKKLVAFISGVPATLSIKENVLPIVEINFLCVLRKLRSKRLSPVLIKEITRRSHLEGIFQAVYTAGKNLPGAISSACYWHRSINPEKLLDVGFSFLPRGVALEKYIHRLRISETLSLSGLRPMEERDVPQVHQGLNRFLKKFSFAPTFSEEQLAHWLLPNSGTIYSYVVEMNASITHFFSFYRIPTTVLNHASHKSIQVAYAYYYFYPQHENSLRNQAELSKLFHDGLIMAKQHGMDVFNCLEIMENKDILEQFKFARGDGVLHYYIYNWATRPLASELIGMVLH